MTTPRQHSDSAARYFEDDTTKCWVRYKNGNEDWRLMDSPSFDSSILEYYVGHEPPPPDKRTITLTVNGRVWLLPEPLRGSAEDNPHYWSDTPTGVAEFTWYGDSADMARLSDRRVHATENDAQAWAEFDKWCRGGGA